MLSMSDVLNSLSNGRIFRRIFAIALWITAILVALGGLAGGIGIITTIGKYMSRVPASVTLGMIVFLLLFIVGIYMIVHTIWIRAHEIADLPDAGYTMIPILCIFLKLCGEVLALITILSGVGMGLLTLFSSEIFIYLRELLGPYSYYLFGSSLDFFRFVGPIGGFFNNIIIGLIVGFFQLSFFYLLAEMTLVLVDIAVNIRVLRQTGARMEAANNSSAANSSQAQTSQSGSSKTYCPSCGTEITHGNRFCEGCGEKMPDTAG